ncbi:fibronectin type III domain-containing protein 7-like [Oryzias latipes]|uniref:Fibronectin type-III domain-containing protein n=1 Tax=Oryzias latipes TaxID=8090 RepID=H2M733_ORYLA|nr:fibronectin type III domain-containing protein 7-like [Oryzias latipes]
MGVMKWLVTSVFLCISSQVAAQSGFELSQFSATSKTVFLKWTRYMGAESYRISTALKSSPNDTIGFVLFGPNTLLGSISYLSQGVDYIFTVEALDGSQRVLSSASINASTAPDRMDPIQTIKPKNSKTLIAEFNLKNGVSQYIIRVEDKQGFFREDRVSSSPAEITNLSPYTEYTLSIMAVSSAGRSQPSTTVTGKTVLPPPQFFTSSPTNDSIVVSWAPVDNAVQYTVSIHKFGFNTEIKYNTSDTNLTVSGLEAGLLYMIKSSAWDPIGRNGEDSLYKNQTTRPPAPSSVNVSVVMNNTFAGLAVSWELEKQVYGYVEYHVISEQNVTCNTTSTSCTLPVGCGELHTFQVIASNEAGPSYPSIPVVFITFPCPPDFLAHAPSSDGNCTLTWNRVPYADKYEAFIKTGDGSEENCNTTSNNCTYQCLCGHTYLMSVLAFNEAGSSPHGKVINYTTVPCCPENVAVSAVSTDTLEITWTASLGAELYETTAADALEVILCNDTAPVCALSDLSCDRAYSVVVTPCNDISGCNRACKAHTKDTAPCAPSNLQLTLQNSTVSVSWTANNRKANYTVTADGDGGRHICTTSGNSCNVTDLSCGSIYEFSVSAASAAGPSLSSYTKSHETEPCCPMNITVDQVTEAMTNVTWSQAKGAHSFITSLTSPRGHARCHTQDSHCLMGCITCGTNYSVTMETYSPSGHMSTCTYQGFSSSPCCPSGVKLYRTTDNSFQVYWRSTGSQHSIIAELLGSNNSYNCTALPGQNSCSIDNIQCGDVFHVIVAPLTVEGEKILFCPQRLYSVTCLGTSIGTVIYRGKRSLA